MPGIDGGDGVHIVGQGIAHFNFGSDKTSTADMMCLLLVIKAGETFLRRQRYSSTIELTISQIWL
jgi:hypothetical protein